MDGASDPQIPLLLHGCAIQDVGGRGPLSARQRDFDLIRHWLLELGHELQKELCSHCCGGHSSYLFLAIGVSLLLPFSVSPHDSDAVHSLVQTLLPLCTHIKATRRAEETAKMIVDPVQAFGMTDMLMKTTTGEYLAS